MKVADDPRIDLELVPLVVAIVLALAVATALIRRAGRRARTPDAARIAANLEARVVAWWWMVGLLVTAFAFGRGGVVTLFGFVSFLGLRELVTLVPSRRADHGTLAGAFFLAVPIQYGLLWTEWYGLFAVFLPVYGLLAVSLRVALSGDTERYLHRVATIHYALMIAVYCVSHAPALLLLSIPGYEGGSWKLLVFLVTVVQVSDVLQFVFGRALGRTPVAPRLSPGKTVEGLVGGVLGGTAVGGALTWFTPFSLPEAVALAFGSTVAGFLGGLVMSAIKRDAGIKDYSTVIAGHGGVMDRVDSLAFAAPLFFHIVRWLHSTV